MNLVPREQLESMTSQYRKACEQLDEKTEEANGLRAELEKVKVERDRAWNEAVEACAKATNDIVISADDYGGAYMNTTRTKCVETIRALALPVAKEPGDWRRIIGAMPDLPLSCSKCQEVTCECAKEPPAYEFTSSPDARDATRPLDPSDPPLELATGGVFTVREACRRRMMLGGADAEALERALAMTERERDAVRAELDEIRREWESCVEREQGSFEEVRTLRAELEKAKADFRNACDVGRRPESRAEAELDAMRAELEQARRESIERRHRAENAEAELEKARNGRTETAANLGTKTIVQGARIAELEREREQAKAEFLKVQASVDEVFAELNRMGERAVKAEGLLAGVTKELDRKSKDLRAWEIDARTAQTELARVKAQNERMREALRLLDPRNATELYERMAEDFWSMTGMMAPGKSVPLEMGNQDHGERSRLWSSWVGPWRERFFDAALSEAGGEPPSGNPAFDMAIKGANDGFAAVNEGVLRLKAQHEADLRAVAEKVREACTEAAYDHVCGGGHLGCHCAPEIVRDIRALDLDALIGEGE